MFGIKNFKALGHFFQILGQIQISRMSQIRKWKSEKNIFYLSTVKRYSISYRQEFEKFLIQQKFP